MSCFSCGGATAEDHYLGNPWSPNWVCECPVCSKCGGPEGDDAIKLSPGEMLCLSCHCGEIDRAIDARYNNG